MPSPSAALGRASPGPRTAAPTEPETAVHRQSRTPAEVALVVVALLMALTVSIGAIG